MIRPLRRAHGVLLPCLAALVAVLVALALVRRAEFPLEASWPSVLQGPAGAKAP